MAYSTDRQAYWAPHQWANEPELHPAAGDELAQAAEAAALPFAGILAADLLTQIKLAHIAIWLAQQHDTVSAAVLLHVAQQAVYDVHAGKYAVAQADAM